MLVQVLDFVACHVWVNTIVLPHCYKQTWHATSLLSSGNAVFPRRGTPRPYFCR
ncbi:MAG: hypothetical protein HDS84_07350 [Bacteroidales bacterium]|nr:hypothetical protein [Bacteroidales bacterium]